MRRKPSQARSQARVARILDAAVVLFQETGYEGTTTNAIAKTAGVPIGSLYQFFPDKSAIMQAIAERYSAKLHQQILDLNLETLVQQPLSQFVEQIVSTSYSFFTQEPGYAAIFMEMQTSTPELEAIEEAADAALIEALSAALATRKPAISQADCDAIAYALIKALGTLLWLSLSQPPTLQTRLVEETKRMAASYLSSYFPE